MRTFYITILILFIVSSAAAFAIHPSLLTNTTILSSSPEGEAAYSTRLQIMSKIQMMHARGMDAPTEPERVPPRTGTLNVIALMVEFPDKTNKTSSTVTVYSNLFNGTSSGSLWNYYHEQSYGALDIHVTVYTAWIMMDHNITNYDEENEWPQGSQAMVWEAVEKADMNIDWTQFDADNNNELDGIFIIHAGRGEEESGWSADIWSHKWELPDDGYLTHDGIYVDIYSTEPEYVTGNPLIHTIGVYAHEFGHVLGAIDLYNTDQYAGGEGIGNWSVMAAGSWNGSFGDNPASMDPWHRIAFGWLPSIRLTANGSNRITLPQIETSNVVYRVNVHNKADEYFLIENRQQTNYDSDLPGEGILIYHVDESMYDQTDDDHYLVDLEQADGIRHLNLGTNRGDQYDPWYDGNSESGGIFNLLSSPASTTYAGSNSGVVIKNFSASGTSMTCDIILTGNHDVDYNFYVLHDGDRVFRAFPFSTNDFKKHYYYIDIPTNTWQLTFTAEGTTSLALLAAFNKVPENMPSSEYFAYDASNSYRQTIIITTNGTPPIQKGRWYLTVYGTGHYRLDVTLNGAETTSLSSLSEVIVGPSPLTNVNGYLRIEGVPPTAFVEIYNVAGELIFTPRTASSQYYGAETWDMVNLQFDSVANGIYYVFVEDTATGDKRIFKSPSSDRNRIIMMKSVYISRIGGPDVLKVVEEPTPTPGDHQVLVKAHYCGVNYADVMARSGLYPDAPKPPFIPGFEAAGEVVDVGTKVDKISKGDRVVTVPVFGGYAEYVAVDIDKVIPIPDAISFRTAAALPVNWITAYEMVMHLGNVQKNDIVLLHGAAGGVGTAAVQLLKRRGATIIATAGSEEKLEFLRQKFNIQHCINYRTEPWEERVRSITGSRGCDLIFDPLGGSYIKKEWKLLAPFGRLMLFGLSSMTPKRRFSIFAALPALLSIPRFHPLLDFQSNSKGVIGINLHKIWAKPGQAYEALENVFSLVSENSAAPVIDREYPLEDARIAHERLKQRKNIGKILLSTGV